MRATRHHTLRSSEPTVKVAERARALAECDLMFLMRLLAPELLAPFYTDPTLHAVVHQMGVSLCVCSQQ